MWAQMQKVAMAISLRKVSKWFPRPLGMYACNKVLMVHLIKAQARLTFFVRNTKFETLLIAVYDVSYYLKDIPMFRELCNAEHVSLK